MSAWKGASPPGNNEYKMTVEKIVAGKLELIVGPMRSNKTAELLRRIETRRQYAKQHVLLLKPSDDTKAGGGLVESRNQNGCGKMEALEFQSADPWAVLPVLAATEKQIGKRVECVAIDEGQFVQDLFLFTKRLLDSGHDVMVSGLELDFRGLPFGEMIDISWLVRTYSGNLTELVAYCSCGARAPGNGFSPSITRTIMFLWLVRSRRRFRSRRPRQTCMEKSRS